MLARRPGQFDSRVVEPGPPPVITGDRIFLIYNGTDDHLVYRTGWALFDKNNPAKVLARADVPIFQPEEEWEKVGQVPNVVWLFYYGGTDKYVGVAEAAGAAVSG